MNDDQWSLRDERTFWRRGLASLLVVGLTAAILTIPPAAAEAASAWLDAEQRFANLVNRERADRGLPTMRVNLQMVRIGRDWSNTMAVEERLYHRPELQSQVFGPWQRLGENVGRTGYAPGESIDAAVDRLHQAFMDSPGHRANILGDYNQVGVGVVVGKSGGLWVTFNFLKGPIGEFPLFEDIGANTHRTSTERVWVGDLARGCQFSRYCPGGSVTRAQMATFVARALGLQPVVSNRFRDLDPRSSHAGYVNALVHAGIAEGCDTDRYCPDRAVTRAQMATFLGRALQLAPDATPRFLDVVPTSPHAGYVNAVAEQAITAGCDSTSLRYCPSDPVRRDQMASFLSRAFEAPVSFWQATGDDGEVEARSSDTSVELGEPASYERSDG